jgi:hypothetical protein
MADYTFDGKTLRNKSGQKLGVINGSFVCAWNSARLGEIDRKNIRDPQGRKVLEFDGKIVKDDRGNKVTTIQDIQKLIDGEATIAMVAAWHFFIKIKQSNFT